jgi:hypothetical protein
MGEAALTTADLLTVTGATVAAITFAQFFKKLFNLASQWVRVISMLTGLAIVVGVTVGTSSDTNLLTLFLAGLVGMNAGMSASAFFDASASGLGFQAVAKPQVMVEQTIDSDAEVQIVDPDNLGEQ